MKFFKYSHFNVHYVEVKHNCPKGTIMFLPGFGSDASSSASQAHQVDGYNFYSISYPGHGHTIAHSSLEFNLELYSSIVVSLIDKLGLKDLILVGHSMGGAIATLVYKERPRNVKKLMLVAPLNRTIQTHPFNLYPLFFPKDPQEYMTYARQFHKNLDLYLKAPCFKQKLLKQIELFNSDSLSSRGFRSLAASFFDDELLSKLDEATEKINKTFYVVYGENDQIVNQSEIGRHYRFMNKYVQTVVIPDADHSPWTDNPVKYKSVFDQFLDKE